MSRSPEALHTLLPLLALLNLQMTKFKLTLKADAFYYTFLTAYMVKSSILFSLKSISHWSMFFMLQGRITGLCQNKTVTQERKVSLQISTETHTPQNECMSGFFKECLSEANFPHWWLDLPVIRWHTIFHGEREIQSISKVWTM